MNRKRLVKLVNEQIQNGILCTTDRDNQPNAAVIGSGRMDDQDMFRVALTDNHTLTNLRTCPKAVYICSEPSTSPIMWRGARLYLVCEEIVSEGDEFDQMIAGVRESAGDEAADRIVATVVFRISSVRPLIDL